MKANKSLMKTEKTNSKKTGVSVRKRSTENNQAKMPEEATGELLNTSELSLRFNLDRAIVRKRLQIALIEPHSRKANETIYLVTEELEDVLADEGNPELDAARLRKLTVEAELKEIDLKVKTGEFGSVHDFTDTVQKVFGGLYRRIIKQKPKNLLKRLATARNEAQMDRIIDEEYGKVFSDLKKDYRKFLK